MKKIVLLLLIIWSNQQFAFSQCETAPANMVSWWTGDNNTIDRIGDNDGTQLNGLNYTVGMVDNAFLFDGIDDMVLVPHSTSLDTTGDMTVMAWVRRIGYANPHQTVFCKGAGYIPNDEPTVFSMRFEFDITEFVFEDSNGNNIILNGPAFEDSMYHHYVYVRQGNTHTLYVDGFLFNNDTFTNPPASTTGLPFTIGAQYHNPTNSSNDYDFYFHGEIDELMLYNRALSNSEIQAIYNAGTDGVCKDNSNVLGSLFWGNQTTQSLSSSDIDGSNIEDLVNGQTTIRRVRINETENKIYWALPSQSKIKKSNLDGSNIEDVINVSSDINVVAIDELAGKVYFSEANNGTIKRCDLNGLNLQTVISGIGFVQGITINTLTNTLYWTEFDTGLLKSANLDGTNIETVLTTTEALFDLEVDPINGFLYFSNRTANTIEKIDLNGGNRTLVVNSSGTVGAISLDLINDRTFWSFNQSGASGIAVVNNDGTNLNNLISSANASYSGVDVALGATLSNDMFEEQSNIYIYPNPVVNNVNFDINAQLLSQYKQLQLNIYDSNGRILVGDMISKSNTTIDMSSFSKGMYIYSIRNQDNILKSSKIIKK